LLALGRGNCKQYSVLKYAALLDAGFAPDDLRLIVLTIKSRREAHAVVVVRHAASWLVLDNSSLALVDSRERPDYVPLFSLDHSGVRQFISPAPPPVASAPCRSPAG
jgi:predicted transglutaminase-like cysteine proteinase